MKSPNATPGGRRRRLRALARDVGRRGTAALMALALTLTLVLSASVGGRVTVGLMTTVEFFESARIAGYASEVSRGCTSCASAEAHGLVVGAGLASSVSIMECPEDILLREGLRAYPYAFVLPGGSYIDYGASSTKANKGAATFRQPE